MDPLFLRIDTINDTTPEELNMAEGVYIYVNFI